MFAPLVKALKVKTALQPTPTQSRKPARYMPWGPKAGLSNQPTLRYWSQRVESRTGSTSGDQQTQETDRWRAASLEVKPSASSGFSKIPVFAPDHPSQHHQTVSPLIQPKLTIGQVNEPLEHEADRIASHPEFSITAG